MKLNGKLRLCTQKLPKRRRRVTASPQRDVGVLVNCMLFRSHEISSSFMAITNKASTLPNEECMPKSQKHIPGAFIRSPIRKIWVSSRQRVTSRVSILTSSRWGGGAYDCTSTEGVRRKTAASPSERSLAAYRGVAAPHKVAVPSSGPLLNHKRNVEVQLHYRTTE